MPPPTNSERIEANTKAIRKIETSVATLDVRVETIRGEILVLAQALDREVRPAVHQRELDTAKLQTRLDQLTQSGLQVDERLGQVIAAQSETQTRISLLEQRMTGLQKNVQRRDQYLWMLAGVVLGVVLTFMGNLIVELLRRNP